MNSYPPELLAQLAPVMFVAGLDVPAPGTPAPVAQSPTTPTTPKLHQDPFVLLTTRLREALLAQRKVAIWQPEKSKSFQIIPVDKTVRFPPRKLVPQDDPGYSVAHSPLSPLTMSSPLHPDGLIAPIWIRKHTTLVPSVFVMFLRIFEYPPHTPKSPLDPPDPDRERDRELEERKRDAELAAEVALRKKSTNERNIKLTVVLMATRRMLDDPSLDGRLTYIRRQSGLDSRAALFVLSPVSQAELGDFVKSLQQALYEPALEYYTAHSKRVRRKRNRHSQAVSSYPVPHTPVGTAGLGRPLRPEGWTVRYEYKMACFAEFRGEDDIALKHYQDAYGMLVIMFGSTAILPPRTKRWAEAKVLADCINIKVAKLYLYNNEHALALSHHNTHIRKFGDFSRGWGIGEETFEFWSWIARQHRILAELLEHGTQSKLIIPDHRPPNPSLVAASQRAAAAVPAPGSSTLEIEAMRTMGVNPSHALQHPGYYYYMAAKCTEARRERFLAAAEAEDNLKSPVNPSPGFMNEKKVDHLVIILELYTKAYELFKKYAPANSQNQNQGRLTLWIAYRIGQTYYESGKFQMAVRFFERIAKSYRREKWGLLLRPLLATWYACARQLGDVELSIRLLVEMLGYGGEESDDPASLEEDLLAVLKSSVPSTPDPEPMVIDLAESQPMFGSSVAFWAAEVKVGEPAAFQLRLAAPTKATVASLPFASLEIRFSGNLLPVVVRHSEESTEVPPLVQRVDLGHISGNGNTGSPVANLRWQPGASIVFTGTLASDSPASLKIAKVILALAEGPWTIQIPFDPSGPRGSTVPAARWLSSVDPPRFVPIAREDFSSVIIRHRAHSIVMTLSQKAPAYLDEDYPILIEVTNADDRALEVTADVLLQPTEIDGTENLIVLDEERSPSLIKGVNFGILQPGVSVVKTLHLISSGAAGERMVDVSIQSTVVGTEAPENPELQDMTETLQTLVVPTVEAIKVKYGVVYKRAAAARVGVADLRTYDHDFWDDGDGGEAVVTAQMECAGPWGLEVASVKLLRENNEHAKVMEASIDTENDIPSDYLTGDEFSDVCRISMDLGEDLDLEESAIIGPGRYEVGWKRILGPEKRGPLTTSVFPLPPLRPPIDGVIALLDVPPTARLHVPISLTVTIRNRHPSRSANVTIQLEPDPSDGFVVAGLRSGRVPIMLPGGEEKITWRLIPIDCGYVRVPRMKIVDKRRAIASAQGLREPNAEVETEGDLIKIINVRLDRARERKLAGRVSVESVEDGDARLDTVLVLP
ncbi:Gryzun, putative trafficking through golgi-domain-containing protein [Mycena albidolilacea]|uniref:Gryzun, putative trafficking through golgi-domain-containing protein n=1 Tax=Mycena albidolilacea TaxID=1033008 RepID=A0AAD7A6I0_9AGAR|nr:Gryzun, putative trafficking through golgi-domain-containing protein [Mycena albidolilacea]